MLAKAEDARLGCRILIVEDDQDDIFLFRRALRVQEEETGTSFELETASNGLEALNALVRQDVTGALPDIIVVDLNMPVMDGLSFLGALRQHLLLSDIYTVVMTTSDEPAVHARARNAGADAIHVKPGTEGAIAGIVADIIRHFG